MQVLLIEDNPADARLVQQILQQSGGAEYALSWSQTLAEGLAHLERLSADVILLDISLPDSHGIDTVKSLCRSFDEIALVVLSGHDDEALAVMSLQSGAQDYLVKGRYEPMLLRRALVYARERKRMELSSRGINADLEARVERRTHELAQANRELEAFAYSVSHDLQAPLRTIGGFAEILATDFAQSLGEEAGLLLERMRQAAQHMGDLMEALLDLSRLSREPVCPETVDLEAMATVILAELSEADPQRTCEHRIQPGLKADGDPRMLEIALRNLLNNAWKFSRNRATTSIALEAQPTHDGRVFCISDNGVGFEPRFAGRLFEPFQRLHRAVEFEGTGIGLATVQRIVQRHGGRVWAESTPGAGARFFFTLGEHPVTPVPAPVPVTDRLPEALNERRG